MNNKIIVLENITKNQSFIVKENDNNIYALISIDGKNISNTITINLNGKHAKVTILGLVIGWGSQILNIQTVQKHQKPQTTSELYIKSALFDKVNLHYKGFIQIQKNAQQSDAKLQNKNMNLSPYVHVISKPYLEIQTDNISCSHGVATGNIDPIQLNYICSRGLSEKKATQIVVNGFFQDILDKIPDDTIRENIRKQIKNRLSELV